MPLPSSGPLSLTNIETEFGGAPPTSMSEYYRSGPFVPNASTTTTIPTSGVISVSNFYGTRKRVGISLNITSPTYNYDVYNNRGPTYVAGISDITVTVNPGIDVGSLATGLYAMWVPNSFDAADTVTIVNNGTIVGMGGNGGGDQYGSQGGGFPGASGGNALYVNRPTTIQNNGTIGGGGGGGGGGAGWTPYKGPTFWASGGGGGAGYNPGLGGGGTYSGSTGTITEGGAGGPPVGSGGQEGQGAGGAGGAQGQTGVGGFPQGGLPGGVGGTGGLYVVGNGFVTWTATGTRNGSAA